MKDHGYKLIELTGTSTTSIEDAVEKVFKRTHKTTKNLAPLATSWQSNKLLDPINDGGEMTE